MLTVSHIGCERGHRALFAPASFSLSPGQALHLQGDNGVGKTSLLRILCGLSPASSGEVRWQGRLVREVPREFRQALFYLGHALSLKDNLNAVENLVGDAAVSGQSLSQQQALAALQRMGLQGRERLPVRVMSQGQKRRVALARLLVTPAPLWVLDEPFVALDPRAVDQLRAVLGAHVARGGMVLLTSHQPVSLLDEQAHEVAVPHHRLEMAR
jgi:heme exporter protein A